MATKWKNIIKAFLLRIRGNKRLFLGLILECAGAAFLFWIYWRVFYYGVYIPTKEMWQYGVVINLFMAMGVFFILRWVLKRIYKNWLPQDDAFYEAWKEKWRKQQKLLAAVFIPALLLSYMAFNNQLNGYYYTYNLSFSYLLFATVLLQYGICQFCIISFMKGKLNLLMDCMTKISAERLAAAVEIEKESIEKAARSERLKVDLISNVSHDLKTPLTSMVGYLELMKKEEMSDTARDYTEVISDKAEKLKMMIESLFSLAKASSGNIQLKPELLSMNKLIEQIFADMEDQIKNSGLHFVLLLTEQDTRLVTDNLHMYRICQNLIENALKYSAKGTRVFVKTFIGKGDTERNREKVCLEITNTAGYFMDFDKEDIVERFARGDKARSSEGNGLGLAIVSTYAGALGGSFDIQIDCDQFKASLSFFRNTETERTGQPKKPELAESGE